MTNMAIILHAKQTEELIIYTMPAENILKEAYLKFSKPAQADVCPPGLSNNWFGSTELVNVEKMDPRL
jgi:hypothetical protein